MILLILALAGLAHAAPPVLEAGDLPYVAGVDGPVSPDPWWEAWGAPELDRLMQAGLDSSFDARAAWSRVEQADAVARQGLSVLLPQASFDVSINTQPSDSVGFQFGISPGAGQPGAPLDRPDLFHTGSAMITASWQLDIFGQQLLAWRASRFDAEASRGDHEAALVSLSTRIAEAWLDVVAANARLDVLHGQLEAQEALLELIQLRYEQGQASAVDVLQQRQSVAATRSQLPATRTVQRTRAQQLAVLVGQPPAAARTDHGVLPEPSPVPPTGLPADLVEQRPDVRAAFTRIESANLRKQSQVRALFPTLRLSAQAGVQGVYFDELRDQNVWGVGGVLSVPLFQGGRTHAAVRAARAAEDIAVYQYNQTLLMALVEVEGALVAEDERARQHEAVGEQVEAAGQAWEVARDRYLAGLDTYLSVLTAWNAYQQAELAAIQTHRDLIGARVQLHDALGGPWTRAVAGGGPR